MLFSATKILLKDLCPCLKFYFLLPIWIDWKNLFFSKIKIMFAINQFKIMQGSDSWKKSLKIIFLFEKKYLSKHTHTHTHTHTNIYIYVYICIYVPYPPYSPDLAPCYIWLFPKHRGYRYETIEEMKEAVTKFIEMLTQEDFHGALQKFLEQYDKFIAVGGDSFEGD